MTWASGRERCAVRGPLFEKFADAVRDRQPVMVDLLYTDMHAGQRTITRFSVLPAYDDRWIATVGRHWTLDGVSPR